MLSLNKHKWILGLLGVFFLTGCGVAKIDKTASLKLRFLDEYVIPKDLIVDSTKIGGLSELDYDGKDFYAICDLPSSPRIYKLFIELKQEKIDTITFSKVIRIPKKSKANAPYFFDSEGLLFNPEKKQFTISSEGSIRNKKDPFIVDTNEKGEVIDSYKIPYYFKANFAEGPRNNGVFEGLSRSVNGEGIWVSTELPLKMDGPTVKLYGTKSPVRFTYYNTETKLPKTQFVYDLGRLRKVPFLPFGMNGVSGILEYKPKKFFVIERAFSAGHGRRGVRVLIYLADAEKATNTLYVKNLHSKRGKRIITAHKRLLFDFNSVRKHLTDHIIDNIEGISFGPKLPNGNQSLILIADNNFNSFTEEMNQVILMEIIPK